MYTLRYFLVGLLLLIPGLGQAQDPVASLEARIKSGETKLAYASKTGYLPSLLKSLDVPVSSQTLVFSKTSLQSGNISPKNPRALYFNDDVYVGWVQGASTIEIMSVDPRRGAIFYALGQEDDGRPAFERVTGHICSVCHYQESMKVFVPRLTFTSVIPDEAGSVEGTFPLPTTDETPLEERWGGWYVTGTSQPHLGNIALKTPRSPLAGVPGIDISKTSNVTDLRSFLDTSSYLSPHSDIVALMVLAHQADVQNLITSATATPGAAAGDPLVRALLFSGAASLKQPVKGTSNFTSEFEGRGPRDSQGRSLRHFDLKTRLFRYPLSYMIYSASFDAMPDNMKAYVYRRLTEVLTGKDQSKDFAHLTNADRTATLEILRDTKPDFPR
jgi:hypothetical protein